ncbi:GntR family transcriptional regulator [Ruania alba]|uniref:DNA-binding transcriptional regulator, GntR family n=1 Tax=Ruania alba TaxID=648782 RepID=A0A1H5H702_9MICO|nr:GntR family transcriptional regulator [Ruania alba]SEE23645.1 DNA-binding transcriptional regulator, GntR family [Ruania alba]
MVEELRAVSLVDAVAESLRLAVISGTVESGAILTEQFVADRFSVARTTAKAAVERLVTDGFLQRTVHRSARVPVLSAADIGDLYDTRILLEVEALTRVAQRGEVPAEAEQRAAEVVLFAERGDHDRMASSDVAMHRALVEAAGSPRLTRMHATIMGEAHICMVQVQHRNLLHARTINAEHRAILDTIAAVDPVAAAESVRSHLVRARDQLLARYRELGNRTSSTEAPES